MKYANAKYSKKVKHAYKDIFKGLCGTKSTA